MVPIGLVILKSFYGITNKLTIFPRSKLFCLCVILHFDDRLIYVLDYVFKGTYFVDKTSDTLYLMLLVINCHYDN